MNCEWADEAPRQIAISSRHVVVLTDQPEAVPKLDQMIRAGMGHSKPAARAKHSRHLREVFWSKDAQHEIHVGITHRPFVPQVGDSKRERRPSPRRQTRGVLGDVETKTDDWRWQGRS